MKAEPTDGLWDDGRTDEDQMGAKYEDLEEAIELIEKKITNNNLTTKQLKTRKIYERLNTQNQHKMIPIPVCLIPKNL